LRKLNKYMRIGMLCVGITFILKQFIILPELVSGVLIGFGLGLELIGVYSMRHDMSKFKNCKRNFLKKCFNK